MSAPKGSTTAIRLGGMATALFAFVFTGWLLFEGPVLASSKVQAAQPVSATQSEADKGKDAFESSCSLCHGLDASGGQGPNIQRMPSILGDTEVVKIIKNGVPGTGMPAFAAFSDTQAAQIAAYIRTLGAATLSKKTSAVTGDPQKGEAVYNAQGCAKCHTLDGKGIGLGPDLTQIGSVRSADYLRAALLNPGSDLPESAAVGVSSGKWAEYLMFRAVTKDGHIVEGMRSGESSFAIILEDADGNYHSLQKPELRSLQKEFGKSFMPSYKTTIPDADLDNLIAYLVSVKGPHEK